MTHIGIIEYPYGARRQFDVPFNIRAINRSLVVWEIEVHKDEDRWMHGWEWVRVRHYAEERKYGRLGILTNENAYECKSLYLRS